MKKILLLLCPIVCSLYGCESDKNINIDQLIKLDQKVRTFETLIQFNYPGAYIREINYITVCFSDTTNCKANEIKYSEILNNINVSLASFDSISNEIIKVGLKSYHRHGDYSIWVEDGALGDVYGYLINHNSSISKIPDLNINDRYIIGIGKKVKGNVYYFSSGF